MSPARTCCCGTMWGARAGRDSPEPGRPARRPHTEHRRWRDGGAVQGKSHVPTHRSNFKLTSGSQITAPEKKRGRHQASSWKRMFKLRAMEGITKYQWVSLHKNVCSIKAPNSKRMANQEKRFTEYLSQDWQHYSTGPTISENKKKKKYVKTPQHKQTKQSPQGNDQPRP